MTNFKTMKRLFGLESERSSENFDPHSANMAKDWRFSVPLYSFIILDTLFWLYTLVLVSDKVYITSPEWFSRHKPQNRF